MLQFQHKNAKNIEIYERAMIKMFVTNCKIQISN